MTPSHEISAPSMSLVPARLGGRMHDGHALMTTVQIWIAENGVAFLFDLLFALIILLAGALAIRVGIRLLRRAMDTSRRVNPLFEDFLCTALRKIGWAMVIMIALQRIGVNIGPLVAGLGVTGFILGFAFQESLGNLASGMMIAINEPFKVGDYVSMSGIDGTVKALNMMATTLATPDNRIIIVPNKVVWGSPITNFTAMDTRRLDIPVGIAYGADINQAKAVALAVQQRHPELKPEPPPMVVVAGLGDSSVNLVLRQWVATGDYWKLLWAMTQEVKEAFDANGIPIPFPQLDVHMRQD